MAVSLELRRYQELIAQQARHTNTIAYLPTGTGKTLIACHLINHRLHEIRVRREQHISGGCVIVFIAPTKALVAQQLNYVKENCIQDIQAHQFNGESFFTDASTSLHVDLWTEREWTVQFEKYEVLFMTPDCMRRLVEQSLIPPKLVDLIIFDECHHIVNKHPMAKLCDAMKAKPDMRPLIFGMTASPVNNKGGNIQKAIDQLEDRMMSTFFYPTPELIQSLQTFTFKPRMLLLQYAKPTSSLSHTTPTRRSVEVEADFSCFGLDLSTLQSQHCIRESLFELIGLRVNRLLKISKLFSAQIQLEKTPLNKYWYRQLHEVINGNDSTSSEDHVFSLNEVHKDSKEQQVLIYPHLESIKEIINQTALISKECGVYCALIAFQYLLENSIPQRALADMYRQLQQQADLVSRKQQRDQMMAPMDEEDDNNGDNNKEDNEEDPHRPKEEQGRPDLPANSSESKVEEGVVGPRSLEEMLKKATEADITSSSNILMDLYYLREIDIAQLDRYYEELVPYYVTKPYLFQRIQHQSLIVYISLVEMFYGLMEALDIDVGYQALDAIKQYHQTSIDRTSAIDVYVAFLLEQVLEKAIRKVPLDLLEDQVDLIPDFTILTSSDRGANDLLMMDEVEHENDIQIMLRFAKIVEIIRSFVPIDGITQKFLISLPKDTKPKDSNADGATSETEAEATSTSSPIPTSSNANPATTSSTSTSADMILTGLISTKVDSFLDLIALLSNGLSNGDFITTYKLFSSYPMYELNQNSFQIELVSKGKFLKYFRDDLVDQLSSPNQRGIMNWVGNDRSLQEKGAAIVFCNMRVTAIALNKLIQTIKSAVEKVHSNASKNFFIRSDVILGAQSASTQQRTLQNMRNHECNLLFATDVAEEGLDIQRCNTIVHFDSPKRDIGFIQRRGRARSQFSLSFHLVADIVDEEDKPPQPAEASSSRAPASSSNTVVAAIPISTTSSTPVNTGNRALPLNVPAVPAVSEEIKDLATFIKQEEETNRVMKTYLENLGVFLFSSPLEKLQLAERYVVEATGAYVDTTSAITLVDIYCENISYDVLSPVLPYYVFTVEEQDDDEEEGGIIPNQAVPKRSRGLTVIGPQGSTTPQSLVGGGNPTQNVRCTLYIPANIDGKPIPPMSVLSSQKRLGKGLAALKCVAYLHAVLHQLDDHLRIFPKRKRFQKVKKVVDPNAPPTVPRDPEENLLPVSIKAVADVLTPPTESTEEETRTVYMYRVEVGNHFEMPFNNIKEYKKIEALNSIGFCTLKPIPDAILQCAYPLTLHHLPLRYIFLEKRTCTKSEIAKMQLFHQAVAHLQCKTSNIKEQKSDMDIADKEEDGDKSTCPPFLWPHYPNMHDLFNLHDLEEWSDEEWTRSSLGTWYIMFPLKFPTPSLTSAMFDIDYIERSAVECTVLIYNLNIIQHRNLHMVRTPLHAFGQDGEFPTLDDLQDMIFTTEGRNMMILSEPISTEIVPEFKLWDNMPGSSVSFATQYSKKGEHIKKVVEELVERGQERVKNGLPPGDEVILKTAYMISGKLTLLNILLSESGLHLKPEDAAKEAQSNGTNASSIQGTLAHIIPEICQPLGRVLWYYMSFISPGVFFRLESCCLALELRTKLQEYDMAGQLVYPPPTIDLLLQGITPRRTHENINSERLEFLGDSFLKYAVSATLFLHLPTSSEEQLTIERTRLINNHYLTKTCLKYQDSLDHVAQYMRILPISTGLEELHYCFPGEYEVNEGQSDSPYMPKLRNVNIQLRMPKEKKSKKATAVVTANKVEEPMIVSSAVEELPAAAEETQPAAQTLSKPMEEVVSEPSNAGLVIIPPSDEDDNNPINPTPSFLNPLSPTYVPRGHNVVPQNANNSVVNGTFATQHLHSTASQFGNYNQVQNRNFDNNLNVQYNQDYQQHQYNQFNQYNNQYHQPQFQPHYQQHGFVLGNPRIHPQQYGSNVQQGYGQFPRGYNNQMYQNNHPYFPNRPGSASYYPPQPGYQSHNNSHSPVSRPHSATPSWQQPAVKSSHGYPSQQHSYQSHQPPQAYPQAQQQWQAFSSTQHPYSQLSTPYSNQNTSSVNRVPPQPSQSLASSTSSWNPFQTPSTQLLLNQPQPAVSLPVTTTIATSQAAQTVAPVNPASSTAATDSSNVQPGPAKEAELVEKKDARSDSISSTSSTFSNTSKESLVCITKNYKTIQIPSKVMADMTEALIGVYLIGCGEKPAIKLLRTIHVLPEEKFIADMGQSCINYIQHHCTLIRTLPSASVTEIQEILGYEFQHPILLSLAFTHSSYQREMNYQRLEYLGDSILDYLVVEDIYLRYPKADEGLMSKLKSTQTCNRRFSSITSSLGLMKYIMSASVALDALVVQQHQRKVQQQSQQQQAQQDRAGDPFVTSSTTALKDDDKDDTSNTDASNSPQSTTSEVETTGEDDNKKEDEDNLEEDAYSKITADIFESIIGAIYIDSYANVTVVREVARRLGAFETQIDIEEE